MKLINVVLTIYVVIGVIIYALLAFFLNLKNEDIIAFFVVLGALLLLLIRFYLKVKDRRK